MLLKGAQAFLQGAQHRLGYIRRQTLFILGFDDLALRAIRSKKLAMSRSG
jgi:hypothetical protein